jgi:hypothetical protein
MIINDVEEERVHNSILQQQISRKLRWEKKKAKKSNKIRWLEQAIAWKTKGKVNKHTKLTQLLARTKEGRELVPLVLGNYLMHIPL